MQTITVKTKIPVKIQTLAALFATAAAVLLPQFLHIVGLISGTGNVPGEIFLPMHLPIILVGFLAGPVAGGAAGFLSPVISFALTGMPKSTMLPFMALELLTYGICAGLIRNSKQPLTLKVLAVQVSGRLVKSAAVLFSFYLLDNTAVGIMSVLKSVATGLPGLILQWALIPLIIFRIENSNSNEK